MNQRYTKPSMKHSAGKWKYFNMNMVELKESQAKDLQHIDSVNKAFLRFNQSIRCAVLLLLSFFFAFASNVLLCVSIAHGSMSSKAAKRRSICMFIYIGHRLLKDGAKDSIRTPNPQSQPFLNLQKLILMMVNKTKPLKWMGRNLHN